MSARDGTFTIGSTHKNRQREATLPDAEAKEQTWCRCIDRLYDAVGRENGLAEALDEFRPFFDAKGVSFLTLPDEQNPQSTHIASAGIAERLLVEYHAHFDMHDEWVLAAQRRSDIRLGATFRGTQLMPPARLRKTNSWNEFLIRHGIADVLSAIVEANPCGRPTAVLSLYRHQGQPAYTVAEARLMARLAPHLRQVLRLHRRLAPALALGTTLQELVQRIDWPVLYIAADGRIVCRNPTADTLLDDGPGWFQQRQGRLWLCARGHWSPLQPRLAELPRSGSLAIDLSTAERACATFEVRLLHGAATHRAADPAVFAVCSITRGARDRERALRELFTLTAAEARVAMQIAEGRSPADIATRTGQSVATVRTHAAAVRHKLEVTRQSQIAARVLAL